MAAHVIGGDGADPDIGFPGNAGNVGGENKIGGVGEGSACRRIDGLAREHVEGGAAEPAVAQRGNHGGVIDDACFRLNRLPTSLHRCYAPL